MKRVIAGLCIVSLCLSLLAALPTTAWATGATILFSPSNLQMSPGGQVSTTVSVSSSVPVNSVDFIVTFPASLVSVASVDTSSTNFPSMFMGPPAVNNGAGTIHFLQSKIGGTTSGAIATINFQAKATGNGSLALKSAKVVANDGSGTDVYSGTSGATITSKAQSVAPTPTPTQTSTPSTQSFRPAATTAPQISSTTHPDQSHWYATRSVTINWTGGGQSYNVAFDQDATTQLPDQSASSTTTASTTLASDGVWYAHVKSLGSAGWSSTSHFKLQADTVGPVNFKPTTEPMGDTAILPKVSFGTTDATSGIDHYELRLDNNEWATVSSPFTLTKGDMGQHIVQVKAVDRAGNSVVAEVKFNLLAPGTPVITSPTNKQLFMLGELVKVEGRADPKTVVDLFLNGKKLESVLVDAAGNFKATKSLLLFAGAYKLVAKAVSPEGIASEPSSAVTLTVDARAVKLFGAVWPGWVVLVGAIVLILLLAFAVGTLGYRVWRLGKTWVRRVGLLRQSVTTDLQQLEQTVDAKVDAVLASNQAEAEQVKAEVAAAVATAEGHLQEVGQQMLQPEPWLPALPILHGKDRFAKNEAARPQGSEAAVTNQQTNKPSQSPSNQVTNKPEAARPQGGEVARVTNQVATNQQTKVSAAEPSNQVINNAQIATDASVVFGTSTKTAASAETPVVVAEAPVVDQPITPPVATTAVTEVEPAASVEAVVTSPPPAAPPVEPEAPIDLLAPKIEIATEVEKPSSDKK